MSIQKKKPRSRGHAGRVRELTMQKRKKKREDEIRFLFLSLQILALLAAISAIGYGLDILIGWERPYVAIAFLIIGIGISVWYGAKRMSKSKK